MKKESKVNAQTTTRTKRNTELLKLQEGDEFSGKFIGSFEREFASKFDGEYRKTDVFVFEIGGVRKAVVADGGLKWAIDSAMVQPNEKVTVKKLHKTDISDGRTVNQYEIY